MFSSGLDMRQVSKVIDGKTIVHPVDIQVSPGQVVALCGGNGAGKSTILRMIVGLTRPTTGSIRLNGLGWQEQRSEYAKQIGYMPDHFNFGSALTAAETIRFYAALRGQSAAEAERVLRAVGLYEVRNKRVSVFSKGMQQRLLFAQALLGRPALLVLDEPTNGLDPYWMDAFVDLVREVKEHGQAVIFSTHQLPVADAVADRAILLMDGQIIRSATSEEFRAQYGSRGLEGAFSDIVSRKLSREMRTNQETAGEFVQGKQPVNVNIRGRGD
nr:ABC transporter ATP-binding protein [Brevibacillus marinus]